MAETAARFGAVHLDVGTGDGAFVRRTARSHPTDLVIGVDAAVGDGLREVSRKAATGKPERGGLPNALFGRLALEDAPGELAGIADALTVLLPWGSLLRAVALPEPAALGRLAGLCKPDARVRILFGYGPGADGAAMRALGLPPLGDAAGAAALAAAYAAAGFSLVAVRAADAREVGELPTTWARKLAFSGRDRRFLSVEAVAGDARR